MSEELLEYADLLREYGNPDAEGVRSFVIEHENDTQFQGMAHKLNAFALLGQATGTLTRKLIAAQKAGVKAAKKKAGVKAAKRALTRRLGGS